MAATSLCSSHPRLHASVHIAKADSFLRAHAIFGAQLLDQAGRDGYVADLAGIGAEPGVPDPPCTEAGLTARIAAYRAELGGTAQACEAARFLLLTLLPLPDRVERDARRLRVGRPAQTERMTVIAA